MGCLLREALGAFRNMKRMFSREFIVFLQRNGPTWSTIKDINSNEQEKLARRMAW